MNRFIHIFFAFTFCSINILNAQFQFNNFENQDDLEIIVDSSLLNNTWEIGVPQKTNFDQSKSIPNAIVTDLDSTYAVNDSSSFILRLKPNPYWIDNFFILYWNQRIDAEEGVDGGVVEVSYDSMQTWVNIYENHPFAPTISGDTPQVLTNGKLGYSGNNGNWRFNTLCWPFDIMPANPEIFARFTFYSDSVDTAQDGWMMDDFEATSAIVDPVREIASGSNALMKVSPNPTSDFINLAFEDPIINGILRLMNLEGQVLRMESLERSTTNYSLPIGEFASGIYLITVSDENGIRTKQVIINNN